MIKKTLVLKCRDHAVTETTGGTPRRRGDRDKRTGSLAFDKRSVNPPFTNMQGHRFFPHTDSHDRVWALCVKSTREGQTGKQSLLRQKVPQCLKLKAYPVTAFKVHFATNGGYFLLYCVTVLNLT